MTDQTTEELEDEQEEAPRTYYVEYIEQAGWGGQYQETLKRVECDHVEVSSGIVRFIDGTGNDVWAKSSDRVIGYKEL